MGDFIVESDGNFNNQSSGAENTNNIINLNGDFIVEDVNNCCNSSSSSGSSVTSFIVYDGTSMGCLGITNGLTLNQIINLLNVNCNTVNTAFTSLTNNINTLTTNLSFVTNQVNNLTTDGVKLSGIYTCTLPAIPNPTLTQYLTSLDQLFCQLKTNVEAGLTGAYLPLVDWYLYEAERILPYVWTTYSNDFDIVSTTGLIVDLSVGKATASGRTTTRPIASITLPANKDNYIFVNTLVTTGYTVTSVNIGDAAPTYPSNFVPLYKITTNATAVTTTIDNRKYFIYDGNRVLDLSISNNKIISLNVSKVIFNQAANYDANYHSSYTNRSLIDKEYLDIALASLSNIWTLTPTSLYYLAKPVGIGTSSPDLSASLTVGGSISIKDGSQGANKVLVSDATGKASWQILPNSIITYDEGIVKANTLSSINFVGSGVATTSDPSGNIIVSITGTVSYFDDLFDVQVSSAANKDTLRYNGSNWVNNSIVQNDGNNLAIGNPSLITARLHLYNSSIGGNSLFIAGSVSNASAVVINDSGSLVVSSQFKYTFGTPGINKILTSDAVGNATWQVPSVPGNLQTITDNGNTTTNSIKLLGSNLIFKSGIYEMSLSGTPTAARSFILPDDSGTLLYGSGTIGRLSKWTNTYKLEDSSVYDNGSSIAINATPQSSSRLYIPTTTNSYGVNAGGITAGVYGVGPNIGVNGNASLIGVQGTSTTSGAKGIGGFFASTSAALNYAVKLQDGSQGIGKFLKDITGQGEANWSLINVTDVTNAVSTSRNIGTTSPLLGGGNLTSDLTLSIQQATALQSGYLSLGDWNLFNNKQNSLTFDSTPTNGSTNPVTSDGIFDALALKESLTNKGAINGYASLDGTGKIPTAQLPSYVDDVLEYTNLSLFPVTGDIGKIYVALDTNKIYRWSGSTYIEISSSAGTVTSVQLSAVGTGLSIGGTNPITSSGTITITNTLPDQIVSLSAGTGIGVAGTYPSFTISNTQTTSSYTSTVRHDVKYAVALTKGQAVYVSSADGTNMIVSKADYSVESTSSKTMGLVVEDGAANHQGAVVTEGLLSGLNTSAAGTEGDPVWLGDDGNLLFGLANKPSAPNHMVFIGIVTKKNPSTGEIFVKVQNGYELNELHDVQLPSVNASYTNKGVLYRDTTDNLWKHATINTLLGYTTADDSLVVHKTGAERITGEKTIEGVKLNFDNGVGSPKFSFQQQGFTGNTFALVNTYGNNIIEIEQIGNLKLPYYNTPGFVKFLSGGVISVDTNTYLTSAITSLNGLTINVQTLANGVNSLSPSWTSASGTHTLNIPLASTNSVTAGLISKTDYDLFNGKIGGTGTSNYVSKFTSGNTVGDSLIQDNGTNLSIDATINAYTKLVIGNTNLTTTLSVTNTKSISSGSPKNYGIIGSADCANGASFSLLPAAIGVAGFGKNDNFSSNGTAIGGYFEAQAPTNWRYSIQLVDGTEAQGRFLKSVTAEGRANWANITTADIGLSGTANRLTKWATSSTLSDSVIRDDGTAIGIGNAPNSNCGLYLSQGLRDFSAVIENTATGTTAYGFIGQTYGTNASFENIGIKGEAWGSSVQNTGLQGFANETSTGINLGGYFQAIGGANNYSLKLQDGTEGAGKFLQSVDSSGNSNWGFINANNIYGGTSGQVLTSNGSGGASFQTPSGGSGGSSQYELLYLSNNC